MKKSKKYSLFFVGLLIASPLILLWILSQRVRTHPAILLSKYRPMRKLIEAQARHETGNFTSRLYREQNNLFGMKNATQRKQLGTPLGEYRFYKNKSESIRDLLIYFDYLNMPVVRTVEEYAKELKNRGYYEDTLANYNKGLNRFIS